VKLYIDTLVSSRHGFSGVVSEHSPFFVILQHSLTLQTFVISPKEKTTVWVKQNVNFFQQNGSVIKIEQN
jgi:hypothetical protein